VVLPRVVRGHIALSARLLLNSSAEDVDLPGVLRHRDVIRRERHVLLLGPLVAGRVVLPYRAGRRTRHADRIASDQIQLSRGNDAVAFLVRFGNRRQPRPATRARRLPGSDALKLSIAAALPASAAALCVEADRRE